MTAILIGLGVAVFFILYFVLDFGLVSLYADSITPVGRLIEKPLAQAVESSDTQRVSDLLGQAGDSDPRIAYLIVTSDTLSPITYFAKDNPPKGILKATSQPMRRGLSRIRTGTRAYIEAQMPLSTKGVKGSLRIGFDQKQVDSFLRKTGFSILAIMILPFGLILLLSRKAVQYAIRPLSELTAVADKISTGDLDARIDFGPKVQCWDIKGCQRTDCKAYMNFTEQCWYVDGTPCEGYEPNFPEKLEGCRKCEVYQAHRSDQIVKLADAFKHMTNSLKASRDDLVKAVQYQESLIQNSFDGIIATDAKGNITIFNRAAADLTGYPREYVIGRYSWEKLFPKEIFGLMDQPLSFGKDRRLRGFAPRESRIKRVGGGWTAVQIAGISLYEQGIHMGKVFFFQDLREIQKLRFDLVASERLAATGQAAASISHSVKNILDGFRGGAYVYKRGKRLGDEKEMDIGWDMVERNVGIIAALVKDLLNFSKTRKPEIEMTDVGALFTDVVESLNLQNNPDIQVAQDIPEEMPKVPLDYHSMHQCLANIVKNASEALDRKSGRITLSTNLDVGGTHAVLSITDNGTGMSPETIEKVSGGMYSTKGSKGTGLGLMVSRKIITEHHGHMDVQSEENVGTTFLIFIPVATSD
jgi:PAS domain S-box-containing protein